MDLYQKIKEIHKNPIKDIAEIVGVSNKYVRQVLSGKRNGTKHFDAKGTQIIELAKQLIKEN